MCFLGSHRGSQGRGATPAPLVQALEKTQINAAYCILVTSGRFGLFQAATPWAMAKMKPSLDRSTWKKKAAARKGPG